MTELEPLKAEALRGLSSIDLRLPISSWQSLAHKIMLTAACAEKAGDLRSAFVLYFRATKFLAVEFPRHAEYAYVRDSARSLAHECVSGCERVRAALLAHTAAQAAAAAVSVMPALKPEPAIPMQSVVGAAAIPAQKPSRHAEDAAPHPSAVCVRAGDAHTPTHTAPEVSSEGASVPPPGMQLSSIGSVVEEQRPDVALPRAIEPSPRACTVCPSHAAAGHGHVHTHEHADADAHRGCNDGPSADIATHGPIVYPALCRWDGELGAEPVSYPLAALLARHDAHPSEQVPGGARHPYQGVTLPRAAIDMFVDVAAPNTMSGPRGIETCALLAGKGGVVTCLIVPAQRGDADSCEMIDEMKVLQTCLERGLVVMGWIHTHPSQSCFMSSMDLHTHAGFQSMLAEAIAVVVAPRDPYCSIGVFRLTDATDGYPAGSAGLDIIQSCTLRGFHPHTTDSVLYCAASHCTIDPSLPVHVLDQRYDTG